GEDHLGHPAAIIIIGFEPCTTVRLDYPEQAAAGAIDIVSNPVGRIIGANEAFIHIIVIEDGFAQIVSRAGDAVVAIVPESYIRAVRRRNLQEVSIPIAIDAEQIAFAILDTNKSRLTIR